MRHVLVFTLGVALFACSASATAQSTKAPAQSVRDGSSIARAVVIDADNDAAGVAAEDRWLAKHYPAWHKVKQALLASKGHHYDEIVIQDGSGNTKKVYFDISKPFNSLSKLFMNSSGH